MKCSFTLLVFVFVVSFSVYSQSPTEKPVAISKIGYKIVSVFPSLEDLEPRVALKMAIYTNVTFSETTKLIVLCAVTNRTWTMAFEPSKNTIYPEIGAYVYETPYLSQKVDGVYYVQGGNYTVSLEDGVVLVSEDVNFHLPNETHILDERSVVANNDIPGMVTVAPLSSPTVVEAELDRQKGNVSIVFSNADNRVESVLVNFYDEKMMLIGESRLLGLQSDQVKTTETHGDKPNGNRSYITLTANDIYVYDGKSIDDFSHFSVSTFDGKQYSTELFHRNFDYSATSKFTKF